MAQRRAREAWRSCNMLWAVAVVGISGGITGTEHFGGTKDPLC